MTRSDVVALAQAFAPILKTLTHGRDGLGIEDTDLFFDETRGYVFRWSNGSRVKEAVLGIPHDAGVYEPGRTYAQGAGVTWKGHYWIALAQTDREPSPDTVWRIAVSRGKEGREGPRGKDGAPGRDLTQLDMNTGRKY